MKKVIALAMVCGFALAFASCGGGSTKSDEAAQDTTMTAPADTTMAPADTTKTDTTQMK